MEKEPDLIDAYLTHMTAELKGFQSYWMTGHAKQKIMFPLILTKDEWDVEFHKWQMEKTDKFKRPRFPPSGE